MPKKKKRYSPKVGVIEGHPVNRIPGMTYWYEWAGREFDVRILQELVGTTDKFGMGDWCMDESPSMRKTFLKRINELHHEIISELKSELKDRDFSVLLDEHDALAYAESDEIPF